MTTPSGAQQPTVSVLIPTFNERENIEVLVPRVLAALEPTPCEVFVVDDGSPDGTAGAVHAISEQDPRVVLVSRPGKMGLSSAVFEGAARASGRYVCVMDADLSHDPEELPGMLERAESGCDIVVGSRFAAGGRILDVPLSRRVVSVAANLFSRAVLRIWCSDVLTGYVLCDRQLLLSVPTRYSARGFKFLLELLATQRGARVCEWPIVFRNRRVGASKASLREGTALAALCLQLVVRDLRRTAPRR